MSRVERPSRREGVQVKYLNYLFALKDKIETTPGRVGFSDLRRTYQIGAQVPTILVDLGIIHKRGRYYMWTGEVPSHEMVNKIRAELNRNRKVEEPKEKQSTLEFIDFKPEKQVNEFKKPLRKSYSRRWRTVKSFTIFGLKIKIYRLK